GTRTRALYRLLAVRLTACVRPPGSGAGFIRLAAPEGHALDAGGKLRLPRPRSLRKGRASLLH
ncbi:MAG: hypothetical protein ACK2U9_09250, partial [Anaerolineae bacterium]